MPIRKAEKKNDWPASTGPQATGSFSSALARPEAYKPIQPQVPIPTSFAPGVIPQVSTRDLGYFFDLASSLYTEETVSSSARPAPYPTPTSPDAPPGYGNDFQQSSLDVTAILVMHLFRLTRVDIFPIMERFHLGPADRQPFYSLTAQPSIRSAVEFNELIIKRRSPIDGVWYPTCTSEIEPRLELAKPGNWTVAKLVMDSMPVWKKMVSGKVVGEEVAEGRGNRLRLSFGDRRTIGAIGDAYGLWWDNGADSGIAEAFYLIEGWLGFESRPQGRVRVKPAVKDASGKYQDPRRTPIDMAVLHFHPDGKRPPQFVCCNVEAQVRMDIIMAGLMTALVVETRKNSVKNELGALPAYDSNAHWSSAFVEEGEDLGWGTEGAY
ncbi:hypothetical protein EJ04DRAFT_549775 [Polyplosphaeria fusca]|uniref:Uncharacterized protein n=1 Tax=Polyplosphaeria fusca TaxID=682080 RepID=A0A9P4R889_9PLEO|nr:hypothetical protein EJ04DRAFT_549775 [Polyplosphaeria fusca]